MGGIFSVALSFDSHQLGVIQRPALWSPDFPHPFGRGHKEYSLRSQILSRLSHNVLQIFEVRMLFRYNRQHHAEGMVGTMDSEQSTYNSPQYETFKIKMKKLTGIDLNAYKNQIHRRVHMLMQRWNIDDYEAYFNTINQNENKLREFLDYLTINVSEFFRNPNKWWELRDTILPNILKERPSKKVKIWSAGSATGEEPYSLAILSLEAKLSSIPPVLATDIDQGAIYIAKRGSYLKRQLINTPEVYLKRYFKTLDNEIYNISEEVKSRVNFQRINLIEDSFLEEFDLILCRNVVIYFSAETKTNLYKKFAKALRPGGYLLVGSTEQIFDYRKLGFESAGAFLYRRPLNSI